MFFANNIWAYGALSVLILFVVIFSGVSIGYFLKGIRPLIWLIIFTVLLQILFSSGGHVFWNFWPFQLVIRRLLINGGYIFIRFLLIIMISCFDVDNDAFGNRRWRSTVLKPLKKIRFPVDTLALMLSIALRFVPTLMDEMETILNAQRSQGVDFGSGSLQTSGFKLPFRFWSHLLFTGAINRMKNPIEAAMETRVY